MKYATAAAFRQALEDRLRTAGGDIVRARRHIVFERILARLVADRPVTWVLKGGVALEVRFRERARTTRDLDLAIAEEIENADEVRNLVIEALARDRDGDWFRMNLEGISDLSADRAGRRGWRLPIRADLDGRLFERTRVDVVERTTETGVTERLRIPNGLAFADIPDFEIDTVDRAHHFAEKLHAYTTEWEDRENTRVKDLTDLVLLIENDLEPTPELREVVNHVFESRGTHAVPHAVPVPPVSWTATYAAQAAEINLEARTIDSAHNTVQAFWFATAAEIL
jgi:hypothetical protein